MVCVVRNVILRSVLLKIFVMYVVSLPMYVKLAHFWVVWVFSPCTLLPNIYKHLCVIPGSVLCSTLSAYAKIINSSLTIEVVCNNKSTS